MFIWMVAPYLPSIHTGGKEYFVYYVSKQLARMGHRVCILTSSESSRGRRYLDEGIEIFEMPIIHNFESYYTPATISCFPLGEGKPDIIHIHEPCVVLTTAASILAKILGVPLVTSYYNDPLPFGPWSAPLGVFSALIDKAIIGYGMTFNKLKLKWADRIIILSFEQVNSSRYLNEYKDNITVLPMGIAPHFLAQPDSQYSNKVKMLLNVKGGRAVLYVGRLDPRKGVQVLIRAAKSISDLNVKLVLIGSSHDDRVFRQMASDQGVDAIFVGKIPNEKLPAWYDLADLLVLPSTHLEESFGSVVLEAWARKKPVIVSDLPGPSHVVRAVGGGMVVRRDSPEDLANAMRRILTDERLAETMCNSGYRSVQDFSYEKIAGQLVGVYEDVLSMKG